MPSNNPGNKNPTSTQEPGQQTERRPGLQEEQGRKQQGQDKTGQPRRPGNEERDVNRSSQTTDRVDTETDIDDPDKNESDQDNRGQGSGQRESGGPGRSPDAKP